MSKIIHQSGMNNGLFAIDYIGHWGIYDNAPVKRFVAVWLILCRYSPSFYLCLVCVWGLIGAHSKNITYVSEIVLALWLRFWFAYFLFALIRSMACFISPPVYIAA